MIKPFENHIIHRIDEIYMYPLPIHISYSSLKLENKVFQKIDEHLLRNNYIKLNYVYNRMLKIKQEYQVELKDLQKFTFSNVKGVSMLHIPFTCVPMKLKIIATLLPKECQIKNEYSYVFHTNILWKYNSPTWISSTIFNINCSISHEVHSSRNVLKLCSYLMQTNLSSNMYVLAPKYINVRSYSSYILTFVLHNTAHYDFNIGSFSGSSISKSFCKNAEYVWYSVFKDFYFVERKWPMKCTKLTIYQKIDMSFLEKKTSTICKYIWKDISFYYLVSI